MDRHIGIVIGRDGAAAGVTLIRQSAVISVESALLYPAGRFFTPEELDSALKTDQADRIVVGAYFDHVVMIDMQIPPELSSEEAMGVVRFQFGAQIPIAESEMICHARRINHGEPTVRVAAILQDDWMHPVTLLCQAGIEADIVTTPLLAGDSGIADGKWQVPEFEPEFAFSPTGVMLSDGQAPDWTEEMLSLLNQAQEKKTGMGREKLIPAAIQMALLSLRNPELFYDSVNEVMPDELRPRRHIMIKRVLAALLFITFALLCGMGTRLWTASSYNNRLAQKYQFEAGSRIKAVTEENALLVKACNLSDEGLKALGKPNRIFTLLSRLGLILPDDVYVESIKAQGDGAIQLVIRGTDDVNEFRSGLAKIEHFTISGLTTENGRDGAIHRVTMLVEGD